MTILEFGKKLGYTDYLICLFDELGFKNDEITDKLKTTKQTIYNAKDRFQPISEALKTVSDNTKDLRDKDVQAIVEAFSECFGTTASTKYDRFAAKRLAAKHGSDHIVKIIQILASRQTDKYVPTVNSVQQIEQKWVNIGSYFARLKKQEVVDL